MQIALLATALLAAVWLVALRPKPASVGSGSAATPTPAQQAARAPDAAKPGKAVEKARSAPSTRTTPAKAASSARRRAAVDPGVRTIRTALRDHKAIAIAFVNPNVADARAVEEELRHVGHHGGRAVTLAVRISQLSRYGFITREVDVTVAPTTVIVAPNREATTIVGFADRFELEQRIAEALAAKRS